MRRLILLALALCACKPQGKAAGPGFDWPVPAGWKAETIPFPIDFAPEIKHRGVEEVRFSPGMFKPDNDERFTYAFVWWLEGDETLTAQSLNEDLQQYFKGLALAVEQQKGFTAEQAAATSALGGPSKTEDAGHPLFEGTVHTWDPFVAHAPITLNVQVSVTRCKTAARTAALFEVSPMPPSNPVWQELEERRKAFRCSS